MLCWVSALLFAHCKTPYDPPLKSTQTNFLVVEGFIDGAATTKIKLSRTRILYAGDTANRHNEINANVLIEDDHQNIYSLADAGDGIYSNADTLNLNPAYQYRLHIFTSNGKEYFSDFVSYKPAPLIDTIGWKLKNNGVQIYVNTHDPNEATRYYRWEFSETWEFHSAYPTTLKYDVDNNAVIPRTDQVHICWRSDNFHSVLLGSSAKLSNDVIDQAPLVYIEPHNQKLSVLYSILVKQYALDVNGYNFWVAMKSNTEQVGSIFDPQPNQTNGNIHCTTDTSEKVVGYIGAGNTVEKRVFINNNLMPAGWNFPEDCLIITVPANQDSLIYYFRDGGFSPISETRSQTGQIGYVSSFVQCVECTLNGTNIKPAFWP